MAACCHGIVGGEGAAVVQTAMHGIKGSLGGWERPFVCPVLTVALGAPLLGTPPPGNVLKELSDPAGAVIHTSRFQVGRSP